jgi:hypothetical protein
MKILFLITGIVSILYLQGITQDSPHQVMEMDCQVCHNAADWLLIKFNHSQTGFPLEGKHRGVDCQSCHHLRNFAEVKGECRTCHTDIHQGRLGPWCQGCHSPKSWTVIDATQAHANTSFPLLGVHARLDCGACHYSEIEGEFSPLKSECFSCHSEDYSNVQSPDHAGSGFSKNCEICHSFYGWQPAQFTEHDSRFPIFSGNHAGEWNQCSDCHIDPGNYLIFSCLNCHEHRKSEMDDEHREVIGYMYESNACYNCHPRGIADDD